MEEEFRIFKENMDGWVKDIQKDIKKVDRIYNVTEENVGNIQHNYELIHEVRHEMQDLKQEIKMLKLVQLAILRPKAIKK